MISTFTITPIPTKVTSSANVCVKASDKPKANTCPEAYLTAVDGTASASVGARGPVAQW